MADAAWLCRGTRMGSDCIYEYLAKDQHRYWTAATDFVCVGDGSCAEND